MSALLEVEGLTKRFSGVTAVKDVSFTLEAGKSPACSAPTARARPRCSTC